jgi:signal transduction histidine kinase
LSENGEKNLSKIIDASRRMSAMIEDVLNFSSLAQKQDFETVSLQQVLNETTELLEQLIKDKKAIITSDNLPMAKVVPSQFRQLFQNLISNSLKFSKKDVPAKINITHRFLNGKQMKDKKINPSSQYLQIKLEDNGIGFEQKDSEKIFELFKRLHTRKEYSGTGIGLAIVKKIMENHKGYITAESVAEKGAIFKIVLPVE